MRSGLLAGLSLVLALAARAGERASRTEIVWLREIPKVAEGEAPKPLLVYVVREDRHESDQERFDGVALKNETFCLATRFFDCVDMRETTARAHDLFAGLEFTAPAVVVFDSARKNRAVAAGRASAMKVFQALVAVGQADWASDIAKTVRDARNLLATYDQIDAARDALEVKRGRIGEAEADGNVKKARQLAAEVEAEQAEIDRMAEKANARWAEIWEIRRR